MRVNDVELTTNDIRQLENADEIAHFFAKLRYDVDSRVNISDYAVLGLGSADLRQQIHRIELIGHDPEDGDITIYLLEVRSVTAKLRNDIARRFRDRPESALLVLTKDYEQLEFVMLQKSEERSRSKFQPLKLVAAVPPPLDRLCFLVRRPALPGAAQENEISGAAKPPPNPHQNARHRTTRRAPGIAS